VTSEQSVNLLFAFFDSSVSERLFAVSRHEQWKFGGGPPLSHIVSSKMRMRYRFTLSGCLYVPGVIGCWGTVNTGNDRYSGYEHDLD
jgi:hypothetical protein